MGYATRAPLSGTLGDDSACVQYVSTSTDDDVNVWDSYLSYLTDCVRDARAVAYGALPRDDSDPDDVDSYV